MAIRLHNHTILQPADNLPERPLDGWSGVLVGAAKRRKPVAAKHVVNASLAPADAAAANPMALWRPSFRSAGALASVL